MYCTAYIYEVFRDRLLVSYYQATMYKNVKA